jgi:hypothetical protein
MFIVRYASASPERTQRLARTDYRPVLGLDVRTPSDAGRSRSVIVGSYPETQTAQRVLERVLPWLL